MQNKVRCSRLEAAHSLEDALVLPVDTVRKSAHNTLCEIFSWKPERCVAKPKLQIRSRLATRVLKVHSAGCAEKNGCNYDGCKWFTGRFTTIDQHDLCTGSGTTTRPGCSVMSSCSRNVLHSFYRVQVRHSGCLWHTKVFAVTLATAAFRARRNSH